MEAGGGGAGIPGVTQPVAGGVLRTVPTPACLFSALLRHPHWKLAPKQALP